MAEPAIWFDGDDWVIAESADEATAVMVEVSGIDPSECGVWKTWPADKPLTVKDDDGGAETRLPAEWIGKLGRRAHVASVNY